MRFAAAGAAVARGAEAGRHEAELLQHPARRRIVEEVRRLQPRQLKRPGNVDQRPAGFGGEALAPVGAGDPIAQLDRARWPAAKPARADEPRLAVGPLDDQEARHAPGRAARRERPRRPQARTARARSPGCGPPARRQWRAPAPGRPRPSRVSATVVRFARTSSLPSPFERPARAALLQFREKKIEKREERGLPSSPFSDSVSGPDPGCPLPGAALYRPIPPIPLPPA